MSNVYSSPPPQAQAAFGPEDAAVLCVGLQRGSGPAAASASLRDVSLPAAPSPRFRSAAGGGPAILRRLVAALAALPLLRRINGVDLVAAMAAAAAGVSGTGTGGGSAASPTLDMAGNAVGPIGAGVMMARLGGSGALVGVSGGSGGGGGGSGASGSGTGGTSSLQGLNLTGCGFGADGVEQLAAAAAAGGGFGALRRACLADNNLGPQVWEGGGGEGPIAGSVSVGGYSVWIMSELVQLYLSQHVIIINSSLPPS